MHIALYVFGKVFRRFELIRHSIPNWWFYCRELLDTFFIVIHKKKLIFLHWYHHVSVLLYCWHSYVYKAPLGILFCVMNYGVHSMYVSFCLFGVRCKRIVRINSVFLHGR